MAITIMIPLLIPGTALIMVAIMTPGEIHGGIHTTGLDGLAHSATTGATHGIMAGVAILA